MVAAGDEIVASDITTLEDYTIRKPVGRLQQAVAQSIPDATLTALTWTTEDFDTHGFHDTVTNNSRITPTIAGYYEFDYGYYTGSMTTPVSADVSMLKNGATSNASGDRDSGSTLASSRSGNTTFSMNGSGDYVQVMAFQDSSAAVNTNVSGRFSSYVSWKFLRPL